MTWNRREYNNNVLGWCIVFFKVFINTCLSINRNFDWQSSGDIKFDYMRYDRAAHGPSDLDNFQVSASAEAHTYMC